MMKIFPESSFFRERRAPRLPTPAEIRAISEESGQTNVRESFGPPPVMIPSMGLLVKYGRKVTIVEAETQLMVYEKLKGQVATPEIFGWTEDNNQRFIYMELIEGQTLADRWSGMDDDERRAVCKELHSAVKAWRALPQDGNEPYVGSLGKQPLRDNQLIIYPECTGPFQGANAVRQFQDACRIDIEEEAPIVFTHDDLTSNNILVSPGLNPKVAAIIDWGQAGWYPAYWESCKAEIMGLNIQPYNEAVEAEWHAKYQDTVFDPVDFEKILKPWYLVMSSRF